MEPCGCDLERVRQQVVEDLVDPLSRGPRLSVLATADRELDAPLRRERRPRLRAILDRGGEVDLGRRRLRDVGSGEREQVVDEPREPPDLGKRA